MNSAIYRQADSRWGSLPYPTKKYTFAGNGCGCCACTHNIIEIPKYAKYTPKDVRPYMVQQGFATKGHGTTWAGITKTLEHYGFKVATPNIDKSMKGAWDLLNKQGAPKQGVLLFRAGTRNGCRWTNGGHYVAFLDYKVVNGKHYFYTKDSGGRKHDGWKWGCYETYMKGLLPKIWIITYNPKTDVPVVSKPTTKYTGAIPKPTLKNGSKGDEVKSLQKFLNWYHNWGLKVDGVFGLKTETTLMSFQNTEGLVVDGVYGTKSQEKVKGYIYVAPVDTGTTKPPTIPTTPVTDNLPMECIDVSYWQGKISQANWEKIKKSCGYAICRASYTSQSKFSLNADSTFATNFVNAKAAGLRVGAYHYSQALTVDEAKSEAEYLCNILKNYSPTFYVAIDYEYGGRLKASTAGKASEVANAFCDVVKASGYHPIIYANTSTLNTKLTNPKYPVWVAQYASTCTYKGAKAMWQYTSKGRVDGISASTTNNKFADVDLSHVYDVYSLDEFIPTPEPTPTPKPIVEPTTYQDEFPNLVIHSGQKIAHIGKTLAYPKGTAKKTYTYGKGKATAAFTEAINKVYPNRSKWSKQCQAGASCDVGAGTVLRYSEYDLTIPRGLDEQIPHLQNSKLWEKTSLTKTSQMKAGDVGIYQAKSDAHIWIGIGDGLIVEANHTAKYFLHVDTDNYTSSNKKVWGIYRACVGSPIRKGDKGTEVIKLQKFLNWAGYNCGNVDGDFGEKTFAATKLFQGQNGLDDDGIFGTKSLAKAQEIKK